MALWPPSAACRPSVGIGRHRYSVGIARSRFSGPRNRPRDRDKTMMKTEDDPSSDFISAVPPAPVPAADSSTSAAAAAASSAVSPPPPPLQPGPLTTAGSSSLAPAPAPGPDGSPTKPQPQHHVSKRTVCDHCRRRRMCDSSFLSYPFPTFLPHTLPTYLSRWSRVGYLSRVPCPMSRVLTASNSPCSSLMD